MKTQHILTAPLFALIGACALSSQEGVQPPVERKMGDPTGVEVKGDPNHGQTHVVAPTPVPPIDFKSPEPNEWFERTRLDLGTYYQDEQAVGRFKFKNPRAAEQRITSIQQSCACSKALVHVGDKRTYEINNTPQAGAIWRVGKKADGTDDRERVSFITVGAEESGEVEVHMTMGGIQGAKDATIDLHTSDDKLPAAKLLFRATGAVFFVIDPPEWHLNEMTWSDKREFRFEISSPIEKNWEIVAMDPIASKKMEATYEKEMRGDKTVWVVKGTYGPGVDERDSGGQITFRTSVRDKTVTCKVSAMVKGPLEMKPGGFLNLGVIPAGKGKSEKITLIPNGDFDLQATKLEPDRVSVEPGMVSFASSKDQKSLVVELSISPEVKKNTVVRGTLKIHLNHPACPLKEVQFTGFVR